MDEPTLRPARRFWRPRFGLRSLFVLVVIAAIPCAWATSSLNWIRQRREAFAQRDVWYVTFCFTGLPKEDELSPKAPGGLWLFGESGVGFLYAHAKDVGRIQQLFPETKIFPVTPAPPLSDDELSQLLDPPST